jgi:phospholipid/cholesterol/gamma-HCH transport system substrate-binding protein
MSRNIIETFTGALVIAVSIWFLVFFLNKTDSVYGLSDNQSILAKFDEIDSVSIGAPVKIGGVKVGNISAIKLDEKNFQAILTLSINKNVKLPIDSSAKIASSGLLGDKYIAITPGGDDNVIIDKGEIKYTVSAVNIENLIGKMIYGSSSSKSKNEDKSEKAESTK